MTDMMKWFCRNYILPQAQAQPKDCEEAVSLDLLENELPPDMKPTLEMVNTFYAVQGFRVGLKMGLALGKDISV